MANRFGERTTEDAIESGTIFAPRFDADGLIAAIATDADTGEVVMFAYMNEASLAATLETGIAHYWSRSRGALWRKGETSGNEQTVVELRTDCDQDVVWLRVRTGGHGANCHTGRHSCFYRRVALGPDLAWPPRLDFTGDEPVFDPEAVYRKS